MYNKLTKKEKDWIEDCKKLMKRTPRKLWLFNDGFMHVMKLPNDGGDGMTEILRGGEGGRVDKDNLVTTIICNSDGGDW